MESRRTFVFVAQVEFDGDNALAAVDKGGQVRFSGGSTWKMRDFFSWSKIGVDSPPLNLDNFLGEIFHICFFQNKMRMQQYP